MTTTTDTNLTQLIINQLTAEQYANITPVENQIYLVEETETVDQKITNAISNFSNTLANVATSGDYADLTNTPTIDQAYNASSANAQSGTAVAEGIEAFSNTLANIAFTGEYSDLVNVPEIAQSDWAETNTLSPAYILNKPTIDQTYNASSANAQSGTAVAGAVSNFSNTLANVAFSGEYSDLLNTPTVDATYNALSANAQSGIAVAEGIKAVTDSLATVATSGEYSDLLNTPTVDTVYNASSTNAQSGTAVANAVSNFSNTLANVAFSGEYSDLLNTPTIDQTYNAASANAQSGVAISGLIANYSTTDEMTNAIANAISTVYKYKGTKATYADLPASGNQVGDVWNIEQADPTHGINAGDNVAWTGSEWDVLAGTVDLSTYVTVNGTQTLTNKTINLDDNTVIGLATVATSGEYSDLLNTPTIDQAYNASSANAQSGTAVAGAVSNFSNTLSNVAFSGEYSDLLNIVQPDWNESDSSALSYIVNKPVLATVATSGEYSDLLNTPTVDQTFNNASTNAQSGVAIANALDQYATKVIFRTYTD